MAWMPISLPRIFAQILPLRPSDILPRFGRLLTVAALLAAAAPALALAPVASASTADHLMCGWKVERRTQTVSIDPDLSGTGVTLNDVLAAFQPWNDLWQKYHGFPIFAPYNGNWQDADILITAHGYNTTWVDTQCNKSFVQRGNNKAIVYIGPRDSWRNLQMLPHEIGHALGFADHGDAVNLSDGHMGYKPCGNYVGVMSYCSSTQNWFMDGEVKGFLVDGNLIRDYYGN